MNINSILELDALAKGEAQKFPRKRQPYFDNISKTLGSHFIGIVGPRGAGKTVLLKQITSETKNSFYISVDAIEEDDLFEIAKKLAENYGVRLLLLDEVHFQKGFEGSLKKIFDFLDIRVVFTSSVALAMSGSVHDLSRRVQLIDLYPFSFREYLLFKKGIELQPLSIDDVLNKKWSPEHIRQGYVFEEYLKGGLHPFLLSEVDPLPLVGNILQKIIRKDVPSIAKLMTDELDHIEKMVKFIGRSEVDGINYTSISKNIGITKYKAEQYVGLLKKSFILNPILPFGTNVLKEPKVLMCLPYRLLYKDYDQCVGALREDFLAESLSMAKIDFTYLKSTRGRKTPDFMIGRDGGDLVLEVGGKGKGRSQFKDAVAKEKIRLVHSDETDGNKRPLFLVGFLS